MLGTPLAPGEHPCRVLPAGLAAGQGFHWRDLGGQEHFWRVPQKTRTGNLNKLIHILALHKLGKEDELRQLLDKLSRLTIVQCGLRRLLDGYRQFGMSVFQREGFVP